jgi:hypothetical protein
VRAELDNSGVSSDFKVITSSTLAVALEIALH